MYKDPVNGPRPSRSAGRLRWAVRRPGVGRPRIGVDSIGCSGDATHDRVAAVHPGARRWSIREGAVMHAAPVAPLPPHVLLVFLLQVGLLLLLALLLARVVARFGMPAVVGELCAGVILGPSFLQKVAPGLSGWLFPR